MTVLQTKLILFQKNGAIVIKHQNNLGYDHALFSGFKKKQLSYKFAIIY